MVLEKVWDKVVIYLATGRQRKTPGAELVGISRATDYQMMSIENPLYSIDIMSLSKLGQCNIYDRCREFEQYLNIVSQSTQKHYIDMITDLDELEEKTYSGDCAFYYFGIETKFSTI